MPNQQGKDQNKIVQLEQTTNAYPKSSPFIILLFKAILLGPELVWLGDFSISRRFRGITLITIPTLVTLLFLIDGTPPVMFLVMLFVVWFWMWLFILIIMFLQALVYLFTPNKKSSDNTEQRIRDAGNQ